MLNAEIKPEDYLTMAEAAKLTPGRPGVHIFYRWMDKGVPLPDGSILKLDHVRVGGKMLTTKAWIDEFIVKNTEAHKNAPPPVKSKTVRRIPQTRRQRQIADARRELSSR